ncbi:MAG TPA: hypothetical protein VLB79_05875 [Solirubrobacterales bacterium]|nr:hypothetical protein [Solirubrobacterales bacterium]
MHRRLRLGVLISIVALLSFAASASACATASLTFSPSSGGPGDTVSFSISGIEPGATYSIELDGRTVASGTNQTNFNGVSGTFTMPDFGGEAVTVTGFGKTFHAADNDSQDPSRSLEYVPPKPVTPPAATPPKETAAPIESQPPAARRHHRHHRPAPPIQIAKQAAKKQRHDSAATGSAVGSAPADAVGSAPRPTEPSSGSAAAKASRTREESGSVPRQVLGAIGSSTRVGPADVPTIGLLAMALILIAGGGLLAFVIYLWRSGPDPNAAIRDPAPSGPDPVEAELQQIIADEMARQLLSDLELVNTPVGSSRSR